jgi:hypothetical protein
MKLTLQQLEAHLWGAANILRGKTAGQDYKNYILSLMFFKRLCDQWECEADDAIAELERQQGRSFTEKQKAVFRKRGEHRFKIPDGSRWGDVKTASTNIGEVLTKAMRAVAHANDELRGVFTVDWNQPAPDGSGKPLIANEVVHALIQHFDEHDLSNKSVPPDVLGRAYEYLIKQFADDAGAKAGEFFTPPEVVDTLVRILEPRPGDTVYDPTGGSGGMLVHAADYLREKGYHATSASYFAQEMNWGNAAIGKINSVLHGLLSPRADTVARFLYHLVCAHDFRGRAAARMEGSTGRQRVPDEVFTKRLLVPLPNRDEQAAIARIVDAVDMALERTRAAVERAREFMRSVLEDAFEKLNAPRRFLRDFTTDVRYGTSKASSERGWGNPVLRIPNVVGDRLELSDLAFVELAAGDVERLRLQDGDLLLVRTNGNPNYVGRSVVFTHPDARLWVYASYLIRVRLKASYLST